MNKQKVIPFLLLLIGFVGCRGPKALVFDQPIEKVSLEGFNLSLRNSLETAENFEFSGSGQFASSASDMGFGYNIRIIRDSVIWVDVKDPFIGIKVARAIIYKDSAVFYNRIESTWMAGGLELVQEKLQLGLEFHHLQSLLLGEPIYLPVELSDMHLESAGSKLRVEVNGLNDDPLFSFTKAQYRYLFGYAENLPLLKQSLVDGPREMMVSYTYEETESGIPNGILISMKWDSDLVITLKHSYVARDVDLPIPFSIPNGYERVQ